MTDQSTISAYLPKKGEEKPRICVDSREAANRNGKKIVALLTELGAEAYVTKLDFGDYLIGEDVAVERKTVFDLANTLTQRFLFDQVFKMREAYPHSIVLIEGYMGLLRKFRRITPESLSGALFTLAQAGVPLIPTIDYRDTATFLATSAKQLNRDRKLQPTIRHRAKTESLRERQLFVVAGLPSIGPMLGENLLSRFRTVRAVFHAEPGELMEVKGIGPQRASAVAKVLDTPYSDRNSEEERAENADGTGKSEDAESADTDKSSEGT